MKRHATFSVAGVLLAMSVAGMPAAAQNQMTNNRNQSMTVGRSYEYSQSVYEPVASDADKIAAMQQLEDMNLGAHDISSILSLLTYLRDARNMYMGQSDLILHEMLTTQPGQLEENGPARLEQAYRAFDEQREKIWRTIADRIGNDKANTMRQLVQAMPDTSFRPMSSERITRINQLITQLDTSWSQRIAGANGTTTDTTTTVTAQAVPPATMDSVTVYTRPLISTRELVTLLENRLLALNTTPEVAMLVDVRQEDLNSPTMSFVRSKRYKIWE